MRARLRDVRRHPSWVWDWWLDWPARRVQFWRALLFERGQGWLRWGTDQREGHIHHGEGLNEPYWFTVGPPLRRLALYLRQWFIVPRLMWFGTVYPEDGVRYRFSWEESRPCWPSDLKDREGRHESLWVEPPWRNRKHAFRVRPPSSQEASR